MIRFLMTFSVLCWCALCARADEVVFFHASTGWCAPCRAMEPDIDLAIREGWRIRKNDVDTQESPGVTRVPCVIYFADTPFGRREAARVAGRMTPRQIRQFCLTPALCDVAARLRCTVRVLCGGPPCY